jgi:hypothetical protein
MTVQIILFFLFLYIFYKGGKYKGHEEGYKRGFEDGKKEGY